MAWRLSDRPIDSQLQSGNYALSGLAKVPESEIHLKCIEGENKINVGNYYCTTEKDYFTFEPSIVYAKIIL